MFLFCFLTCVYQSRFSLSLLAETYEIISSVCSANPRIIIYIVVKSIGQKRAFPKAALFLALLDLFDRLFKLFPLLALG